jgi:hypothetical protein
MKYTIEVVSCGVIYILSFIKIGRGIQTLLRFCHRKSKGCHFGITDERGFMNVTVDMGIGVTVYMPRLIKIGSAIQN